MAATIRELSCADDYDPNSMPVDKARAFISKFLAPITVTERLHIRAALGAYDVQAIDTLIGDINPPAELMLTQTDRKIAEEQRKTYEVQEAAQRFRELVFAAIDEGIDWDAEQLERSHFAPDSWFRRTSINFRRQQTQGPHAKVRLLLPLGEGDERDYALALEGLHRFAREGSWDFDGGGEFLAATQNCVEIWAAEVVRQLKDAKTYSGEAFESVRAARRPPSGS